MLVPKTPAPIMRMLGAEPEVVVDAIMYLVVANCETGR